MGCWLSFPPSQVYYIYFKYIIYLLHIIYMCDYMYIVQSLQKRKVSWLCPYRDRVFLNFELRVFLYFAFMFWAAPSSADSLKRIVAWQLGLPMRNNNSGPSQFVAERFRVFFFSISFAALLFHITCSKTWESGRWFHDYFLYLVACFMIFCSCFWAAALSTTKHPQQC